MAKHLSMDLRERIVTMCDAGDPVAFVAETFNISCRVIYNLLQLRAETGSVSPRVYQPGRKPKLDDRKDDILKAIDKNLDLTLEENIAQLELPNSVSALCKTLKRWKVSIKKSSICQRTTTP